MHESKANTRECFFFFLEMLYSTPPNCFLEKKDIVYCVAFAFCIVQRSFIKMYSNLGPAHRRLQGVHEVRLV